MSQKTLLPRSTIHEYETHRQAGTKRHTGRHAWAMKPMPARTAMRSPADRPPVLRFLLLFAALLAIATGLAVLS